MRFLNVKLLLCLSIMLGMSFTPAHARTLDEILASKTISIAISAADPPHGFLDAETNSLQGIMIDVANAVADHLGVKATLVNTPFDGLIPSLESGRVDFMSAPLFITEKRAKVIDFTVPIYGWGDGLLVSDKSEKSYNSFADLDGLTIGTLVSSVQYDIVKENLPNASVMTYPDYPSLVNDVRAGRVDVGFVDPPNILYIIKSHAITGLRIASEYKPRDYWQVGAAVQKDNTDLLKAVNDILEKMKRDGELHTILAKWGVAEMEIK